MWPDPSAHAAVQAAATPTCAPEVHDESQHKLLWLAAWFVRDVPYGADCLAENILDPSHVQFSHHKVIGNRNQVSTARLLSCWVLDVVRAMALLHGQPGFWESGILTAHVKLSAREIAAGHGNLAVHPSVEGVFKPEG